MTAAAEGKRLRVNFRKWATSDDFGKEYVGMCQVLGEKARKAAERAFLKTKTVWGPFTGPTQWAEVREVYR
jgi:hypothetical protein